MKVFELIGKLSQMPQNAEVFAIYDGSSYTRVEHAFISRSGKVNLADNDEVVYHDADRPLDSPTKKERPYWNTDGEQKDWNWNYDEDKAYDESL
ncbi:hypothetical protein EVB81_233 [Rhizobium phage RHph_I46]|uniref:Uncharacterized protein n=1 Tax=Rhizobium phage RHph_I1_9 TaxID=2509729 RepID=A0A7S5UXR9_9CAUD|nr:hypothetical protein PP936_gp231 [Rhizobium phage RHph_I1_9]QIG69802.1 hypothetical protein EVB81_233 [Rhizobium phage RHph_I46]QIG71083.1 hypothetical protein EVB92_233 [Rhizobium phage RHph_I9]QIG73668.1 hypothetical protein EVC04_231 [Rhizobium phage RHph_I1_9]QIG76422.1 hypothetical protein EVC25_233 [Rhizobium phage RHph_I34]